MQRKRYIFFYKEAERIKRLGRIAMASLLLAESIILPQFSNANDKTPETKAFKKQTSNTIKGRRDKDMVPKQGVQEKKEEKTTARKDIEAMINARNVPEAVEIYKKIIENRKNAEYDMEYKNAWKEI
ncbi:MAG: hypothetical protein NZ903_02055, partial [Candidatus Micrarchaeota archaeon]|nr:hypothetical protein [Candidatus Micrarchaeota archaeon]